MSKPSLVLEVAMEMAFPRDFLDKLGRQFGPEATRACAMSTSVGGIGPLLKERIIEQSAAGLNVIGVSLLYETVWVQAWHEWGQINLQKRDVGKVLRQALTPTDLGFKLTFYDGQTVDVEVWLLEYGSAKVYFLAAPPITNTVYPGPKDMPNDTKANPHAWAYDLRLKHSWVVGRGALHLMKKLGIAPEIAVLSETPTIFTHHRLIKDEFQRDDFFAHTRYIFNDHTPLEYAHPIWDQQTLETVKLDPAIYAAHPAWNASKKTLDVTSLLVGVCEAVYGVAQKHAQVMKAMPSLKEFASKIQYVTNGVRKETWQAPELANVETMTDEQLLQAKLVRKKTLLDWAWRHCRLWPNWAKDALDKKLIAWTRRITPYKRLDLLVKVLKNRDWRNRFMSLDSIIFVGGRVHQQDNHAQDIVYELLDTLEKDHDLQQRVIPLDNFNVWEAPILYQGADASIMLADDTREASATGFMKAQMNGGAIIATADGAVPEFVFFQGQAEPAKVNGFFIPYIHGEPTPLGLLEALEAFSRSTQTPSERVALVRAAIAVTKNVSVARTVRDMEALYEATLHIPTIPLPVS